MRGGAKRSVAQAKRSVAQVLHVHQSKDGWWKAS